MANLTLNQALAVKIKSKNILVSASAGTGKTTVMIERIADLISKNEVSCDSILVVTFTIAAAQEMKARLLAKLKQRAQSGDENCLIAAEKCNEAAISTLHSVCADIVRSYFYVVGADPAFYILDEQAAAKFKRRAHDTVRKTRYAPPSPQINRLMKICGTGRNDDGLAAEIDSLYEFLRCLPNAQQWKNQALENLKNPQLFCNALNAELVEISNLYANEFARLAQIARHANCQKLAEYCVDNEQILRLSAKNGFAQNYAAALLRPAAPAFGAGLKKPPDALNMPPEEFERLILEIGELKSAAASGIKKLACKFGGKSVEQLVAENQSLAADAECLFDLCAEFWARYDEIKREAGALDFSDLEHLALQILENDEVRAQLKERYKMIFVDEYQDINGVQEEILRRLQGENSIFCVGDVKQSIYGFRQCSPKYFLNKQENCALATPDTPPTQTDAALVELNDNFRSDEQILHFTNELFRRVMTREFGGANYAKSAMLTGGQTQTSGRQNSADAAVSIKIINSQTPPAPPPAPKTPYKISAQQDASTELTCAEAEATEAANFIIAAVSGEICGGGISYGDIAVLMPTLKEEAQIMRQTLIQAGIPVSSELKTDQTGKEIKDILNFLRALDNPLCDIPLAGCALSYFGNFTHNELAQVKLACPAAPNLYAALEYCVQLSQQQIANAQQQAEAAATVSANQKLAPSQPAAQAAPSPSLAQKCREFLSFLAHWRVAAQSRPVAGLVAALVAQSGYEIYLLTLKNGRARKTRLDNLIISLENNRNAKSVDKYLAYLAQEKQEKTLPQNSSPNSVKLLSVHKSKGLEFKIVIGAALSKTYNEGGENVFLKDFSAGLGVRFCDAQNSVRRPSLSSAAVSSIKVLQLREEKLRLLYVLCTRAKCRLHLIISDEARTVASPRFAKNFAEIIAFAAPAEYIAAQKNISGISSICLRASQQQATPAAEMSNEEFCAAISDIDYVYPFPSGEFPAKVVSSAIKERLAADESENAGVSEPEGNIQNIFEAGSNAKIGTAYHKLFEKCAPGFAAAQIEQQLYILVSQGVIEAETASEVRPELVQACLNNNDLLRLIDGRRVYHEMPFMLNVPYNTLFKASPINQTVILQGVIDMLLVGENSAVIIDFKHTNATRQKIIERYFSQLASYALAAKNILRVETVEAYAFSVLKNELIKIPL